jgi:LuxR family transcriptional regulator, maltose regulon positive regulatory protein
VLDDVHVLVAPVVQAALAFLVEQLPPPLHLLIAGREARTEGWVAGLQLAALTIQARPGQADVVSTIRGDTRYLADYLAADVLAHLPDHLRSFVLQTSILDRMCSPLCDVVMGREAKESSSVEMDVHQASHIQAPVPHISSRLILDELERRNLFIVPLDDERYWYRYHHLFAEMLRLELRTSTSPAQVEAGYA